MDFEKRYDIIIIGAGVLGAASAYHLMKNNPSKKISS
ncbi:MAG: FAD-binding oxidoreductase [Nitrososphaerota archaeon]|nr:FAD-binding oxidoreductase [Nitrososphaerota archaeon]